MKEGHKLALVVAYYISKFDKSAYQKLGFGSSSRTHQVIGRKLDVKASTIKNMRDEFDPIHDNDRKGWYQRELTGSRLDTVKKYSSYSEDKLLSVVRDILYPHSRAQYIFDEIDREEISDSDKKLVEGELVEKKVMLYKRNQKSTKLCKERDKFTCQGCGFHYQDSIVECHHIKPLSMLKENVVDIENLVTLCPTCHRLAHMFICNDYDLYTDRDTLIRSLRKLVDQ